MLYPINVLIYPSMYNQFTLNPGSLGVIQIVLNSGGSMVLEMNQLIYNPHHMPQDFSMRSWISMQQGGNPVVDAPPASSWLLTALQKRIITIYDAFAGIGPYEGISIGLTPGNYWLNVLNLVNETNSFFLEITGA